MAQEDDGQQPGLWPGAPDDAAEASEPPVRYRSGAAEERAEAAFAAFRSAFTPALRQEVESALRELVYEYSPSNRENRFVVGGAVEQIVAAAMRVAGVPVGNLGHDGLGADLGIYADALREDVLSLKATFSKSTTYRLVNFLGTARARDMHPTLFIQPEVGFVLGHSGHPLIHDNLQLKDDAIVLGSRWVAQHAEANPEWLIEVSVPVNPKSAAPKVASQEVARTIMERPHHPLLGSMASTAKDDTAVRIEQLDALARHYRDGLLTDSQFDIAKRMLLGE